MGMPKGNDGKGKGLSPEQKEFLASIAQQLIRAMGAIDDAARRALEDRRTLDASMVVGSATNPMAHRTGLQEVRSVGAITSGQTADLRHLRDEPFIARVVAEDEDGERETYYFARSMPLSRLSELDGALASYRGPLGRLAEREPGDDVQLRMKKGTATYTVVERVRLRPSHGADGWDGRHDQIQTDDLVVTIASLVEFLATLGPRPAVEDVLAALEAAANENVAIQEGLRRRMIERISLRDEAILDQYQGEVFRLPVNRRLMLSGPPGTGKTTTLIKRIAQKGRPDEVSDEERELASDVDEAFRPDNWVMYTPTELLKLYLKEAFARESVAASDRRVRTWHDERRRLARDVVRILKSETGGRFILEDDEQTLVDVSSPAHIELANSFRQHFEAATVARYASTIASLSATDDAELSRVIERVRRRTGSDGTLPFRAIFDLVDLHAELASHEQRLTKASDEALRDLINAVLVKERSLIDDLARILTSSPATADDDDDEPEPERAPTDREGRAYAIRALKRALADRAKELHDDQRSRTKTGRNRQVLDWLGQRVPSDAALRGVGATLTTLERVRFLAGTYRNVIDNVPTEYQRFRREALKTGSWYRPDARGLIERSRVSGLEVDVLLLVMLRHARTFLQRRGGQASHGIDTRIAVLDSVKGEYVTQVLVDEATDFSAVQLACMKELARPEFASFFVCGDVNQRITSWGVRTLEELRWIADDFEVREVSIGYRQSRRLAALAMALTKLHGTTGAELRPPPHVDDADIPPLLVENLSDGDLGRWLAERVREVAHALQSVPSIAIFVDGDDRIDPLVRAMRPHFAEYNLDVVGCKEGKVVGTERQVRVFDVRHIKGLEFEAVFFVGVDALAANVPDLFDKFLFVGATRAATYLGLTSEGSIPAALERVRAHFRTGGW